MNDPAGTQGEGAIHAPRAEAAGGTALPPPDLGLRLLHRGQRAVLAALGSGAASLLLRVWWELEPCGLSLLKTPRHCLPPPRPVNFFFDFPSPSGTLPPAKSACCPVHLNSSVRKLTVQKLFPNLSDLLKLPSYFLLHLDTLIKR